MLIKPAGSKEGITTEDCILCWDGQTNVVATTKAAHDSRWDLGIGATLVDVGK